MADTSQISMRGESTVTTVDVPVLDEPTDAPTAPQPQRARRQRPRVPHSAVLLSRIPAADYMGMTLKTWDKAQERAAQYRAEAKRIAEAEARGETVPRRRRGRERAPLAPLPVQQHRRTKLYKLSDLSRYRRELDAYWRRHPRKAG